MVDIDDVCNDLQHPQQADTKRVPASCIPGMQQLLFVCGIAHASVLQQGGLLLIAFFAPA